MKSLLVLITMLSTSLAFADKYRTFLDLYARDTATVTEHHGVIDREKTELNGRPEHGSNVTQLGEEGLKVISRYGHTILEIPDSVLVGPWIHQYHGTFSNGDVRYLTGKMIINGIRTEKLIELYATD